MSDALAALSVEDRALFSRLPVPGEWWEAQSDKTEPSWLVAPLFASGKVTLVHGAPKDAGKTTFMLHAVKAMLKGAQFLGADVKPVTVVYVTEEAADTFKLALHRAGITADDSGLLVVDRQTVADAPWDPLMRVLAVYCRCFSAALVVIDTLAHFAQFKDGQEQDAGEVAVRMRGLLTLADRTQAAVVIVCHDRKSAGGRPTVRVRGSNAVTAAPDQLVSITPPKGRTNVRVLHVTGRLSAAQQMVVDLTPAGYVLVTGAADGGASEPVVAGAGSRRPGRRPALKLPRTAETALPLRELAKKNRMSESKLRRLLPPAAQKVGAGKARDAFRFYMANPA